MSPNPNLEDLATVAALIDHTLLKPDATQSDIARLCAEAREWRFATVCVNSYWVRLASETLGGSGVKVCTTVGFPLGAQLSSAKLAEAQAALSDGAAELDMVLNVGALRSDRPIEVEGEIRELATLAHSQHAILKVILETCLLTDEEKITACKLSVSAGADFVKTSTGFSSGGATVADVLLMRQAVGSRLGVKASGGVRTLRALQEMVAAGANRIGTSSGISIMHEVASGANPADTGAGIKNKAAY